MRVLAECSEINYVLQVLKVFRRCRSKQFRSLVKRVGWMRDLSASIQPSTHQSEDSQDVVMDG